ncbi:hypothetical protein EV363DRAFT_1332114 [Boletus edulis]|nr:hypothetical protein EV363DRAFT_1332114 [Boletus edulis]
MRIGIGCRNRIARRTAEVQFGIDCRNPVARCTREIRFGIGRRCLRRIVFQFVQDGEECALANGRAGDLATETHTRRRARIVQRDLFDSVPSNPVYHAQKRVHSRGTQVGHGRCPRMTFNEIPDCGTGEPHVHEPHVELKSGLDVNRPVRRRTAAVGGR